MWSDIQNAGHQLIVVSSAATGLGVGKLQIEKPSDIITKQAAAAVGQCELMYTYDRLFGQYNHTVAQMLLTWEDFDHENRLRNLQNTLERLLQLHTIPIINENDPVATRGIFAMGDNDTLAALVATLHPRRPGRAAVRHRRAVHRRPPHPPRREAHPGGGRNHPRD